MNNHVIGFIEISADVVALRFEPSATLGDVTRLAARIADHNRRAPGPCVYAADCRRVTLFTPEVSRGLIDMMRTDNPRVRRTGALLTPGATFGLQVERMFREADNPARQAFHEMDDLIGWLRQVTPAEACQRIVEYFSTDD